MISVKNNKRCAINIELLYKKLYNMSKKYQYFARKRGSMHFSDVETPCTHKKPNNYITCSYCLHRVGVTKEKQRRQEEDPNKVNYYPIKKLRF